MAWDARDMSGIVKGRIVLASCANTHGDCAVGDSVLQTLASCCASLGGHQRTRVAAHTCCSHSEAMARASCRVGTTSGRPAGLRRARLSNVTSWPPWKHNE